MKFLSHAGRSLCFAVPTSFLLWAIYSLISKILGHGCEPVYDRSADSLYSGFTLILNCFLAALNPALFCLFEFWSCWRKIYGGQGNCAAVELFSEGVIPLVIYFILATKKGWLKHYSPETRSQTLRKVGITAILFFLLIPFADQILSAPSNISKSFQVFTQTKKIAENTNPNNSTFMTRTLAKTLGEAGKTDQAMFVLLGAIEQDLHGKGGNYGNLVGHFNTLEYIDPANELTTKAWLKLCKPVASRLEALLIKFQNNEKGYYLRDLAAGQLSKQLIIGYLRHGASAEAFKWQKIAAKFRRLKYGDVWSHDYLQLATTAHHSQLDDEALAILQSSIALSESYYANHTLLDDSDSSTKTQYLPLSEEVDLYEKIAKAQAADSWHQQNLPAWKNSRLLHEKAYSLMKNKNYQAAEPLLLESQAFDSNDTGSARAWSIYQNLLGTVELKLDKTSQAEKHYRLALQNDLLVAQGGPKSADVARDLGYLAALYQKQGKLADAGKLLRQALEMDRQVLGDFALETKVMEANLIAFNTSQQRFDENESLYKQAILRAQKHQNPDDVLIDRINRLANFYLERDDFLSAEEQLAKAFKVGQDMAFYSKPTIANLDILGDHYLSQRDYAKAERQYERAYQVSGGKHSFDSDEAIRLDKLTKLYIAQRDFAKAAENAKTALWIRKRYWTPPAEVQKNEAEYLALLKKTNGRD